MGSVGHRHREGSLNADGRRIAFRKREDLLGGSVGESSGESSCVVVGSEELKDRRKESYCHKVLEGLEPLEAWWQAFCDEEGKKRWKRSSAVKGRFECSKSDDVIARISWLSKEVGRVEDVLADEGKSDEEKNALIVKAGKSIITKVKKRQMLDSLLMKTYERAMTEEASAKDVSACLDVMARHDMVHGDIVKPELKVVFPQLDAIFGGAAMLAVEKRLGIGGKPQPLLDSGDAIEV